MTVRSQTESHCTIGVTQSSAWLQLNDELSNDVTSLHSICSRSQIRKSCTRKKMIATPTCATRATTRDAESHGIFLSRLWTSVEHLHATMNQHCNRTIYAHVPKDRATMQHPQVGSSSERFPVWPFGSTCSFISHESRSDPEHERAAAEASLDKSRRRTPERFSL